MLDERLAAEPSEPPPGCDDSMVRQAWFTRIPHVRADRASGAGATGERRDVTVRRHATGRNASYDVQHAGREGRSVVHQFNFSFTNATPHMRSSSQPWRNRLMFVTP